MNPDNKIIYDGRVYTAAICPVCGGKIYPADALASHVEHHDDRRAYAQSRTVKELQAKMQSLR